MARMIVARYIRFVTEIKLLGQIAGLSFTHSVYLLRYIEDDEKICRDNIYSLCLFP